MRVPSLANFKTLSWLPAGLLESLLLLLVLAAPVHCEPRSRRQLLATPWQCPSSAASSRSSRDRAFVALHSPASRQDVNVFQARKGWKAAEVDSALEAAQFDASKPTVVYTHGYTQTIQRPWLRSVRQNFDQLQSGDQPAQFNLMLFDWSDYGQRAYGTSVSYVPYLGKLLAEFIDDHLSRRHNYSASRVHLVGYSLSAHIVGQTGRRLRALKNPLGQITALDPTGICFHTEAKFANEHQLRPDDAKLVVARHYDMGGLGARRPIGGVDIFVNGGSNQPSMGLRGPALGAFGLVAALGGASSHMRATQHESSEPFQSDCQELAYACSSYQAYLAGECADCGQSANKCYHLSTLANLQLGLDLSARNFKRGTKMYAATGPSQFCQFTYQLVAKLSKRATKEELRAVEEGALELVLAESGSNEGDEAQAVRANLHHKVAGNKFTQLLQLSRRPLELADEIRLGAGKKFGLKALEWLQVNYMSALTAQQRRRQSARYCPRDNDSLVRCR